MQITQSIDLNLSIDGIPPHLHMPQGDGGRIISASLWDGATTYSPPDGTMCMLRFRKPDGTGGLYDTAEDGTKINLANNVATIPVALQVLAVGGPVHCQVELYAPAAEGELLSANRLATFAFILFVAPSVYPDAEIISGDYINIVSEALKAALDEVVDGLNEHQPRINADGKWELWDATKNAYVATEYTAIGKDGARGLGWYQYGVKDSNPQAFAWTGLSAAPKWGEGDWLFNPDNGNVGLCTSRTDNADGSGHASITYTGTIKGPKGDPGSDAAVTSDNVTAALGYKPVNPNQIVWATPEQYGAVGDGATDDTDAINACLAANRNVIFSKTYKIKADKNNYNGSSTPDRYTYGVSVPSGRTLLFGGGAKLVCQTSNAAYSAVLCLYGTSDVSIIGATIVGDRATNTLTTGEWGHGIVCRAANNVIIRDCTIYNCFGDGIVIGTGTSTATDEDAIGSDICVENCKIYNNRRQGITVGGGKNITIKDCEIYEINGTAPQAGIDIEPNQATTEVSNVLISNCYFHDNAAWDITNTNGAQTGIVIENCRCGGKVNIETGDVSICGGSYRSIQPVGGQLTISDITVDQIFGNPENTVVRNSKIIGNEADSYTIAFNHDNGYALMLIGCEITNARNIILKSTGIITFVGCKIVHKTDRLFSSQGHIRAFNTVFDFSDAAVSAQPINCATIELNDCDFFTNGKGTLIGINDETDVKDWINNRFHGSLTTLSYKANRLINNVFNFSHMKIKPTATGARIGNVWTDLEEGACTDEAIKSYGYLKLEDLPKYGGGVS